jgi:heme O synthase-like polyprenyltransferase
VMLLVRVARLFVRVQRGEAIDRPTALSLYKYSMSYLALLFLVMALERTFV